MALEQVGFYHLEKGSIFEVVPSLVDKIYGMNLTATLYHDDPTVLEKLDQILWTYTPLSFIPHCCEGDEYQQEAKIILRSGLPLQKERDDVLIALSPYSSASIPSNYTRIVDMFEGGDEDAVNQARMRWKHYSQAGTPCVYWVQTAQGKWEKAKSKN